MKKLLAILMGLMLAVSVFAGCTTQQPADEPDEPTAAPDADHAGRTGGAADQRGPREGDHPLYAVWQQP